MRSLFHITPSDASATKADRRSVDELSLRELMMEDLRAVFARDPSATSLRRVLLFSAGLRVVWSYRWQHWLWQHGHTYWARVSARRTRRRYASDIHPAAQIGRRFVVDHGVGVVIGETAVIGNDCLIYQGVTLGMTGKNFSREGKRHPTLGNDVLVGAGAVVLGNIIVGDNVNIGAGAVVVKSVPSGSTVVGIAAHVIGDRMACPADDSNWGRLLQLSPDLKRRLDEVDRAFGVVPPPRPAAAKRPSSSGLDTRAGQTKSQVRLPVLDSSDEWYCGL